MSPTNTQTMTIEHTGLDNSHNSIHLHTFTTPSKSQANSTFETSSSSIPNQTQDFDIETPRSTSPSLQKWNQPRGNIARLASTFFSMFVFGLNDGAWGALIPYLEKYYGISYTVVSLVFLCPFAGYTIAAFTNSWFHTHFGQRGIAILAPICYLVTYITLTQHPPWPVVVVFTVVGGFGSGLMDAAWSSFAGHMVAGNVLEGSLHACYALGATMAPLIVTHMVVQQRWAWFTYYYMMSGLACVSLVVCGLSFAKNSGSVYRAAHSHPDVGDQTGKRKGPLTNRITWLCSAFFLLYVGAEVALGGWIVSFMLRVRGASPYVSGVTATGFWGGMALGRVGLGVVTHFLIELTNPKVDEVGRDGNGKRGNVFQRLRLTERSIVTVYLLSSIVVQLLFWLVPSIAASAVFVALLGMFLGPIFPSGIIIATKLLPPHLHVGSIGFSTALGGTGGAVFPFVVGAIAQAKGVQVLQPIVLTMLAILTGLWWCFPRVNSKVRHE